MTKIDWSDRTQDLSHEDVAYLRLVLSRQPVGKKLDPSRKLRLANWLDREIMCHADEEYCRPTQRST